jgi:hypothetical protein
MARSRAKARRLTTRPQKIPRDVRKAYRAAIRRFLKPRHPKSTSRYVSAEPTHNVIGVGVARKRVGKTDRRNLCVVFYVRKKLALGRIAKRQRLPSSINGVPTDVIEAGTPRLTARPGSLIVVPEDTMDNSGTLGAVVQDEEGKRYLLSNNHVLANINQNPIGHPVLGEDMQTEIATLSVFVPLDINGPNEVDAALARLDDPSMVRTRLRPPAGPLADDTPVAAILGHDVCKRGAGSGFTTGVIHSALSSNRIEDEQGDSLLFIDAIAIEDSDEFFSVGGDSGSLIVDREMQQPVGLLIGRTFSDTDTSFSIACPIGRTLQLLSQEIGSDLEICL